MNELKMTNHKVCMKMAEDEDGNTKNFSVWCGKW